MGVEIKLDDGAALALFDFLSRTLDEQNGENLQTTAIHDGELWALNSLLGALEKALSEPFCESYRDHVNETLEALVVKFGAWPSIQDGQ